MKHTPAHGTVAHYLLDANTSVYDAGKAWQAGLSAAETLRFVRAAQAALTAAEHKLAIFATERTTVRKGNPDNG